MNYLEPVFEKKLSETDVEIRLAYPCKQVRHICSEAEESCGNPIDFLVIDYTEGYPYIFRLNLRKDKEGHLKPEITGQWKYFVRTKGLKRHDKVIFIRHPVGNTNGVVFTVAVEPALTVFGEPQPLC